MDVVNRNWYFNLTILEKILGDRKKEEDYSWFGYYWVNVSVGIVSVLEIDSTLGVRARMNVAACKFWGDLELWKWIRNERMVERGGRGSFCGREGRTGRAVTECWKISMVRNGSWLCNIDQNAWCSIIQMSRWSSSGSWHSTLWLKILVREFGDWWKLCGCYSDCSLSS